MTLIVPCPSCKAPLQIRAEYVGQRVVCPRCSESVSIPADVGSAEAPRQAAPLDYVEEVRPVPRAVPRQHQPSTAVGEGLPTVRPVPQREPEYDDRPRRHRRPEYRPCPRCGKGGAERVAWTPWGSFYGPAMLTHVRCPGCGYAYNGGTGRSNALGIFFFTLIPLLLLVGINAGLWFAVVPIAPSWRPILIGIYVLEGVVGLVLLVVGLSRSGGHGPDRGGTDRPR